MIRPLVAVGLSLTTWLATVAIPQHSAAPTSPEKPSLPVIQQLLHSAQAPAAVHPPAVQQQAAEAHAHAAKMHAEAEAIHEHAAKVRIHAQGSTDKDQRQLEIEARQLEQQIELLERHLERAEGKMDREVAALERIFDRDERNIERAIEKHELEMEEVERMHEFEIEIEELNEELDHSKDLSDCQRTKLGKKRNKLVKRVARLKRTSRFPLASLQANIEALERNLDPLSNDIQMQIEALEMNLEPIEWEIETQVQNLEFQLENLREGFLFSNVDGSGCSASKLLVGIAGQKRLQPQTGSRGDKRLLQQLMARVEQLEQQSGQAPRSPRPGGCCCCCCCGGPSAPTPPLPSSSPQPDGVSMDAGALQKEVAQLVGDLVSEVRNLRAVVGELNQAPRVTTANWNQ